tara:strand:- start:327 stop:935 length:609 start_codon:yes stop_codon:yes gene_type:complete
MNKKLTILFALFTAFSLRTTAQVGPVIRTNLTDIFVGRYSLGTEVFLQDQFSLGFDVDYISRNVFVGSNHPWYPGGDTDKRGFIIEPQTRWYLRNFAVKGTYAAISGFFGYARYSRVDEESWVIAPPEWMASGFSFHLGHQFSFQLLLLEAYFGVTWAQNKDMGIFYEDRALFPQPNGMRMSAGLRFGFDIGYLINKNKTDD